MEFEDLEKIKLLREIFALEDEDKEKWKVTRNVKADIHSKIRWAKYGWEMAKNDAELAKETEDKE